MKSKTPTLVPTWDTYEGKEFEGIYAVGLAGLMGSGKTTIAKEIKRMLWRKHNCLQISFADRLKKVLSVLVGTKEWEKTERIYPDGPMTAREFLQWFGTEYVQYNLGRKFWVDAVMQDVLRARYQMDRSKREPLIVIIDDLRFPHEKECIDALGTSILIKREKADQHIHEQKKNRKEWHISEMPEGLGITNIIENSGSVADVAEQVIIIAKKHPRFPRREEG